MKNSLVFLAINIILLYPWMALGGSAEDAGRNIGTQVKQTWGNPEAFNNKLANPLLTGEAPLTTLDGSTSGIAQISCPGTKTLFEILVQPGQTSDLTLVNVSYDSNIDGNLDSLLALSVPVSGACANGFISCQPGTWNDCHWYSWTFENAILGYQEVVPGDLGGCYCFNSGCSNAGFWPLKDQILRSLGAGVAAVMTKENPRYAAAKAEIEGTVIRYYGQNSGDCSLAQGPFSNFGHGAPEDFYEQSVLLTQATEEETASQSSDPDSFYHLVTNSIAFTHSSRQTCQVERDVVFDSSDCEFKDTLVDHCIALENDPSCRLEMEVVYDADNNGITTYRDFSPTGAVPVPSCRVLPADGIQQCVIQDLGGVGTIPTVFQSCGENCFNLIVGQIGNNYWSGWCTIYETRQLLYIRFPEVVQSATLVRTTWDDYMQIFLNDQLAWCGPDHCDDPDTLPSEGAPCERNTSWDWSPNLDLTSYFQSEGEMEIRVRVEVADAGEGYAYIRILLDPESDYDVCYDWWKIERTYVCENQARFNPDLSRADKVLESLTEDQGNWSYMDPAYPDQGTISINLPLSEPAPCIKACKLKKVDQSAQATPAATSADFRLDSTREIFIYRTCEDDICPVKDGEQIVVDCQCLSEFNLAYGVMETLRQAAVDMICSDGTKKPSLLDQ